MDGTRAKPRFPWYRKVTFGSGHLLMVLAVSMWFSYSIAYFERVIQLSAHDTGTIILVSQVFGAVSTPFVGMWSDQCVCKYPGRRKIFHLMGNIAVVGSYFFIWHSCLGCADAEAPYQVLYYASFAAIFQFGAAVQIATLSLIPELAKERSEKVELNSIRFAFTVLGGIFVFVAFWILLSQLNNSTDTANLTPDDQDIFWVMAAVVIFVGGTTAILFQIFVKESGNVNLPKKKWYKWGITPTLYLSTCAFLGARMVVLLTQSYLPLYLLDTLKMDRTSIAKGPLIQYISSFVITLVAKRCSKYINDKMLYFLGLALVWAGLIWFWCADPTNDSTSAFNLGRDIVYGASILLGGGGAILYIMSLTFISNVIGKYTGSSAFIYGWVLFCDRLMNGAVVKVVQGYQPDSTDKLADFYRSVLVYVPFVGTGIGLLSIAALVGIQRYKRRLMPRKGRHTLTPSVQNTDSSTLEDSEDVPLLRKETGMTMLFVLCCKPESKKEIHVPVEDHDGEDEDEEDDDNVSGFQGLEETLTI